MGSVYCADVLVSDEIRWLVAVALNSLRYCVEGYSWTCRDPRKDARLLSICLYQRTMSFLVYQIVWSACASGVSIPFTRQ